MESHYEEIKKNIESAAEVLCRHMPDCAYCPAARQCDVSKNGMVEWLNMEDSEDDN